MGKRVLVAVDLEAPVSGAITYARELTARLGATLLLLGVAGQPANHLPQESGAVSSVELGDRLWRRWEETVLQCHQERLEVEIFIVVGRFWEEVGRFLGAQPGIQFLVVGIPRASPVKDWGVVEFALKSLKRQFSGEILVVREHDPGLEGD